MDFLKQQLKRKLQQPLLLMAVVVFLGGLVYGSCQENKLCRRMYERGKRQHGTHDAQQAEDVLLRGGRKQASKGLLGEPGSQLTLPEIPSYP